MVAGDIHESADPIRAAGLTVRKPDTADGSFECFIHAWVVGSGLGGYMRQDAGCRIESSQINAETPRRRGAEARSHRTIADCPQITQMDADSIATSQLRVGDAWLADGGARV
jgi:hypothetical protein